MLNDNYLLQDSTASSTVSELASLNTPAGHRVATTAPRHHRHQQKSSKSSDSKQQTKRSSVPQQQPPIDLATHVLVRSTLNTGFGFDLRGERPCFVGAVRRGSIADKFGLEGK